jgi:hypothetical protein
MRVDKPVYHLLISFDPTDVVTPEEMQLAADRMLRALDLSEHQTIMVGHRGLAYAHMHVMVNRVHPETGLAWERWQDWRRIERVRHETEHAMGLREVPGRLNQPDGRQAPDHSRLTAGERRAARRGTVPFIERVREYAPEYRAARSWEELAARLEAHGLRLEPKREGFVITDGERQVKASRVDRELSRRQLEARLGPSRQFAPHFAPHVAPRPQKQAVVGPPELRGHRLEREPGSEIELARTAGRSLSLLTQLSERLAPRELAQLRAVVTAPEAAIARKVRRSVRDTLLGRDDDQELGL